MMEKILRPYTIVPPSLYIERSADRQVENIIKEMGRPGYVLVSRQMGKTNLLLNARRKFSSDKDKFVYVDLSNIFETDLDCFRNIIDIAIETNLDVFLDLDIEINTFRTDFSNLPPHKQHERELRMLLNRIEGKLIIVLDEIDALTKTDYSDRIFSQIRSIYFARVNYSEFDRLTYLLSGVVEPSDLIKDPNLSPFNIGYKIFLNDFNETEFREFVNKAGLNELSPDVIDRVYYWTNGNPRITWDIFSIIEDETVSIQTATDVDKIISHHYLTSFDKPPIDNIREIVKKDQQLKDAIIEINYGKGNLITDSVKQKLYLSGIINIDDKKVEIKNRIIKSSLSLNWIENLEESTKDFFQQGIEYYNKSAFKLAIDLLSKSLNDQNLTINDNNVAKLYIGLSYYYDNQFDQAKSFLTQVEFDKKELGKFYSILKLHLGYIYILEDEIENAWTVLNELVEFEPKNEFELSAKINLIQIGSKSNDQKKKELCSKYVSQIVKMEQTELELEDSKLFFEAKTVAGQYIKDFNNEILTKNELVKYLEKLESHLSFDHKTNLYLNLYELHPDDIEKIRYLSEAQKNTIENSLKFNRSNLPSFHKFSTKQLRFLEYYLFKENLYSKFNELIDYELSIRKSYSKEKVLDKLLGFLQEYKINENDIYSLAEYFYLNNPPEDFEIKKNLLTLLSNYSATHGNMLKSNYEIDLLEFIFQNDKEVFSLDLITFLAVAIDKLLNNKNYEKAYYFIKKGFEIEERIPKELKDSIILINFFELLFLKKSGYFEEAKVKANEILELSKKNKAENSKNPLLVNNLKGIINECFITINELKNRVPILKPLKPNRNDIVKVRYKNGKEITTKYKKVEIDIKNGLCIVLN